MSIARIVSKLVFAGVAWAVTASAQERGGGIRQAVSDKINSGYVFDAAKYDPETVACEAPNVWRRIGTDRYVLMYDIFGIQPHNFGFSETTDFVNFKNLGRFNEGVMKTLNFTSPKHGAIIHLTLAEAQKLAAHWKFDLGTLPVSPVAPDATQNTGQSP